MPLFAERQTSGERECCARIPIYLKMMMVKVAEEMKMEVKMEVELVEVEVERQTV